MYTVLTYPGWAAVSWEVFAICSVEREENWNGINMTPISSVLSDFSYMIYLLVPFGFLLVWAIIGALRRRFLHPLSRFPGPAVASVTDAWKAYQVFMGDFEKNLLELHRKYGSLVRIGPNSLSVSHVTGVKTIYGAGRVFKKRYGFELAHVHFPLLYTALLSLDSGN